MLTKAIAIAKKGAKKLKHKIALLQRGDTESGLEKFLGQHQTALQYEVEEAQSRLDDNPLHKMRVSLEEKENALEVLLSQATLDEEGLAQKEELQEQISEIGTGINCVIAGSAGRCDSGYISDDGWADEEEEALEVIKSGETILKALENALTALQTGDLNADVADEIIRVLSDDDLKSKLKSIHEEKVFFESVVDKVKERKRYQNSLNSILGQLGEWIVATSLGNQGIGQVPFVFDPPFEVGDKLRFVRWVDFWEANTKTIHEVKTCQNEFKWTNGMKEQLECDVALLSRYPEKVENIVWHIVTDSYDDIKELVVPNHEHEHLEFRLHNLNLKEEV